MPGYFNRWRMLLGLLQAALLAANAAAHPIDHDARQGRSQLSNDQRESTDVAALADGRSLASDGLARRLLSDGREDGDNAWSPGAARGVERAAAASTFVTAQPGGDDNANLTGIDQRDPLNKALRSVINVNRQSKAGAPAAASAAASGAPAASIDDADIAAAVLKMEASLAGVLREALDARLDNDGRVTFSLVGIDGFHVDARDGAVSLGHGDSSLVTVSSRGESDQRRLAEHDSGDWQPPRRGGNPLGELIDLVLMVLRYPLVWVLAAMLLIGKITLMIATAQSRKRARRHRSASQPVKVKLKRSRIRSRFKRSRSPVELQEG